MKSERSYPIYKVNKKAEASLVGGHPWVYENDILEFPETEPCLLYTSPSPRDS